MGDYGYDEYDEDEDERTEPGDGPAGLRAALKRSEKELRQLRKQLDESQKTIGELSEKNRASDLAEILRSKSVDPRVSRLYPSDAEASEEAVTKWLDENKDILPAPKTTEDPAPKGEQASGGEQELLPDPHRLDEDELADDEELSGMREVFETVQRATAGARPGDRSRDITSKLDEVADSAESFDAAVEALNKLPGFKVAHYQS